jgi:hypothetical protein
LSYDHDVVGRDEEAVSQGWRFGVGKWGHEGYLLPRASI